MWVYKIVLILIYVFISSCAVAPNIDNKINEIYKYNIEDWNNLTLREKIAQMIMVRVRGDYYSSDNNYRKSLEKWLKKDGVGGVISFGGSIHGSYYNINQFQKWAKIPLLVAADYERGLGQWMSGGTLFPSNMALAATGDSSLAYEQGKITAIEARALGVHVTFSPVMDINNNPNNPIINFRSYSDNPETVSKFGVEFIKGAQENGLIACAKHFPGHGNTETDSHTSLPTIDGDKISLTNMELEPFRNSINANVKMIMVGHISLPGLDDSGSPASHSNIITTQILRTELGFKGVVVSDGLEMGGLTKSVWSGESAIRAVEAGVDILLLPIDVKETIESIEKAVKSGRLSEERINESVKKIWKMKHDQGVLSGHAQPKFSELEKKIGIHKHRAKSLEIAKKSITIVKDDNSLLPLQVEKIDSLAHIILSLDDNAKSYLNLFSKDIIKTHRHVKEIYINSPITELGAKDVINQIKGVDNIIVSMVVRIRMDKGIATIDSTHSMILSKLSNLDIPLVVFSFGSPYLPSYDNLETYVCAFGYGSISMQAASNALWGRAEVNGKLPIDLSPKLKIGTGIKKKKRYTNMGELNILDFYNAQLILKNAIESKVFPGAQISISKDGKSLFNGCLGSFTYDKETSLVSNSSIYDVASLTKVLVTTPIIMKLIEQKKLSLDQKVSHFYPQFYGDGKENITIKNLLTHSSGIPGYYQFYLDENFKNKEDIINYILEVNLNSAVGEKYEYSDLGFILLTSIIEKVSGKSIDRLAHQYIFDPLGMKNTRYLPPVSWKNKIVPTEIDSQYRGRLIHGEVHDENAYLMGGVSGHAGIFANSIDISYYAQMLLNRGTLNGKRYFNQELIEKFTTLQNIPEGSDMALGWDTPSKSGKGNAGKYFSLGSYGHLGFTGTSLWVDPNENIIIVLLTNRVHPSRNRENGSLDISAVRRDFYDAVMEELVFSN